MRRKSGRNTTKSTEEKVDSPKKSNRPSSKRHKRSSSRSSEDSEEEIAHTNTTDDIQEKTQSSVDENYENDSKSNVKHTDSDVSKSNKCNSDSSEKTMLRSGFYGSLVNKDAQDHQEQEGPDENEEKYKGKSNSNNKSKIEQTSNNIEPEIEHENVQGTPQSPSNDNADNENVENIKDTTNLNVEGQNQPNNEESGTKNAVVSDSEAGQENTATNFNFESEYTKENISQENKKYKGESPEKSHDSDRSNAKKHSSEKDEKSRSSRRSSRRSHQEDKPEVRDNEKSLNDPSRKVSDYAEDENNTIRSRRRSSNTELGKEKAEDKENTASKKRITLRRSPPANKDNRTEKPEDGSQKERRSSVNFESCGKETDSREDKSSKKITLKRNTLEEKSEGTEQVNSDKISSINEETDKKRRLSSFSEDKTQTVEEKSKVVLKRIKLIRNFSQDSQIDEERIKSSREQRKKWGSTNLLAKLTTSLYKIDVESIKIVCPSVEFLSESEVKLEDVPRERRKSESDALKRKISIDNKSEDSDRPDYERQTSEDSSGEQKTELNPNIIAMNRKISIVDDTASKLKPPPSPAKNPASDVLFITNLVRPFTVKQLKELLERTGKIKENGFWTDRIKSKCYVHYNSMEEAEATRNALHGVHWPIGNGKKLIIDYSTVEELEKARNPAPAAIIIPEKIPEKENREPERSVDRYKEKEKEREERRKREVREWDVGKEESRRRHSRSRSKSRERARKHSRRSYTPEYIGNRKLKKVDEPIPQKLMDDLFLKTKATPSIYWQPLSPEEIATKQQQRLVRMEEHKRRIEENRSRLRDPRRGSYRRR